MSSFIARWGRSFFHKFIEKIKAHKLRLELLVDCTDEPSVQEYISEREKLNSLLLQEETYWKQRAKLFWLTEGDNNTRFFYASASAMKKTNKVEYLINEEGVKVEDQDGMCKVVIDYFTLLFTMEGASVYLTGVRQMTVTEDQNRILMEDFTFDEFNRATKQMHPVKAFGPDDLNPAFFQSFWSVMGQEIFRVCRHWLATKCFPGDLNNKNVVLIPKK